MNSDSVIKLELNLHEDNRFNFFSLDFIIPFLWFLRSASRGLTYWFDPQAAMATETDYLKGSPIDRTFLLTLEILGLTLLIVKRYPILTFIKNNFFLIIFYIYMVLSISWSEFPDVSFKRWVRVTGDLIMVMLLLSNKNPNEAIKNLIKICSFIVIPLSVLFIKYFRELGVSYDFTGKVEMWIGVTTHKNSLGQLVCITALFYFWYFIKKGIKFPYITIVVFVLCLWLLHGSKTSTSKTSLGIFFIGIFFLLFFHLLNRKVWPFVIFLSTTPLFYLFVNILSTPLFGQNFVSVVINNMGGDLTLTGRTLLWDEILQRASEHAIFGGGYGSFWIGDLGNDLWNLFPWHPGQAHNGYIDIYIDLGIVGLILISLHFLSTLVYITKEIRDGIQMSQLRLTIFLLILIYNITESSFAKPTSFLWFVFLLMTIQYQTKNSIVMYSNKKSLNNYI